MKTAIKLFVAIFFILAAVRTTSSTEYTVSGKVRYSDNNEIVTSGVVRVYTPTGEIEAETNISNTGDYILGVHRIITQGDVIGIADDEWEDFVPTGFPNQIDPTNFTHLNINANLVNIDIYVQRMPQHRPAVTTTISGLILNNNKPVKDAIVYAKIGNEYYGFGISDKDGRYSIKNLPHGDYILIAHKVGSESASLQVNLGENNRGGYNFELKSKSNGITNPFEFALAQNYPNPFNPNTVISYSVAAEGNVTLKVFNAAGQLVNELVNAEHQAGIYNVEFNAASLSSGVYFYRLESNGFTATNKMILVK
jgi:hypothetical protein